MVMNREVIHRPIIEPISKDVTRSVSFHNVDHLLPYADDHMQRYIKGKYGLRGTHLASTQNELGMLIDNPDPQTEEHAAYIAATIGKPFKVFKPADIQNGTHPPDTLIVPYANTREAAKKIKALGQEGWGLHPDMVELLRNKASFHELIRNSDVKGLQVPDFEIAQFGNFESAVKKVLSNAQELYSKYGLTERYPLGFVARAELSDGNYGSSIVHQERDGKIIIVKDGSDKIIIPDGNWEQAIKASKAGIKSNMKEDADPSFVITRYMDIADSPGLSVVVKDGEIFSLGLNSQIQENGSKACVGTSSYDPKTEEMKLIKERLEEQMGEAVAAFLNETSQKTGIALEDGPANVDLMRLGEGEIALQKAQGIYEEGQSYAAESNARFSGRTAPGFAVMAFTGREPTVYNLQETFRQGVHAIDSRSIYSADPSAVRAELFEITEKAKEAGDPDLAFMRVPADPAAFILTGDRKEAEKKIDRAIKAAKGKGIIYVARSHTK